MPAIHALSIKAAWTPAQQERQQQQQQQTQTQQQEPPKA